MRLIVHFANNDIMSISKTLTVKGVVVACRLVGYKRYWRLRIDSVDGYMIGASGKYV